MNTRITLPTFPHTLLGFDGLFRQMEEEMNRKTGAFNYPPHNVVQSGDKVKIEMAVAGFKEDELSVTVAKGDLIVTGNKENKNYAQEYDTESSAPLQMKYLHHGLALRDFELKFILGDAIKVSNVKLEDGILTINLEKVIPEEHKPKKLKINAK